MLKTFIETIVKALVDKPDQVVIEETVANDGITRYRVQVAPEDVGKVIGKGGRIVNALRVVARAAAMKEHQRIRIEIAT